MANDSNIPEHSEEDSSAPLDPLTGAPLKPRPNLNLSSPSPSQETNAPAPDKSSQNKVKPLPKVVTASIDPIKNVDEVNSEALQKELKHFNWGAFCFNWLWGLCNKTYLALLCFIPFVGWLVPFVLGFKGNAWAWKNKEWQDLDHFRRVQRAWAKWAFFMFVLSFIGVAFFLSFIMNLIKQSEPYQVDISRMTSTPQISQALGEPIHPGFFIFGTLSPSEKGWGRAEFVFSIKGTQDKGKVFVAADHDGNKWIYDFIILRLKTTGEEFNLTPGVNLSFNQTDPLSNPETSSLLNTSTSKELKIIHLHNGRSLKGKILQDSGKNITVDTEDFGKVVFGKNEIASVE